MQIFISEAKILNVKLKNPNVEFKNPNGFSFERESVRIFSLSYRKVHSNMTKALRTMMRTDA